MLYIAGWIMLWFRPYYGFLLTFAVGLTVLALFFDAAPGALQIATTDPEYTLDFLLGFSSVVGPRLLVFLAVGAAIVTLRKWMKSRERTNRKDKALDAEMDRIRAEIAARDGQPPTTS